MGMALVLGSQVASAIDYRKNTIAAGGTTNRSTFTCITSSSSFGGSNTVVSSGGSLPSTSFGEFDWTDQGFGRKTIDQRIRDSEQKLNKLYFIRDVCRKLEDEIRISFEKKDIRDVLAQVSETLGTKLPYEAPEGTFLVDKSDVSGMPADQFLNSIAQVCGLVLKYERSKLVFTKPEKKAPSQ